VPRVGAFDSCGGAPIDSCVRYLRLREEWDPSRDSPLSALVELWLGRDHAEWLVMRRERAARAAAPAPATVEQRLDASGKAGDKFYNYWG
jgi:hypothetical protein